MVKPFYSLNFLGSLGMHPSAVLFRGKSCFFSSMELSFSKSVIATVRLVFCRLVLCQSSTFVKGSAAPSEAQVGSSTANVE